MKTPDWMQCSLKYDIDKKLWFPSYRNNSHVNSKHIFNKCVGSINNKIFNGNIPDFCFRQITHEEWIKIKTNTNDFNDQYFNCSNDAISKLYLSKGCHYIQISNKGLYKLKNDINNFNVPLFNCEQKFRIRTKIHTRKNKKGFCNLSVTISCMPKNIKNLENSKYSLNNINKIPKNLVLI